MGADLVRPVIARAAELAAGLFRNLLGGLRLALFLPVHEERFRRTLGQAFLLFFVSLSLNFAYDFFSTGAGRQFNIYGLNYQATLYLLFLFSVVIVAARVPDRILPLIVLILAVTPTTFIAYTGVLWLLRVQAWVDYAAGYWTCFVLFLLWHLAIVTRVFLKVLAPRPLQCAGMLLVYVALNVLPWFVLPNQPLWHQSWVPEPAADAEPEAQAPLISIEDLFYRQDRLVASAADALHAQRPGVIDLYFVGFAAYADEDVFLNEARLARELFDHRFDTRNRSILLANNRATLETAPLANLHNLERILEEVALRMDVDEDLLFLFLNSHGSETDGLTAEIGGHELNAVTPAALHALLERSGIRWRIIVISACHSGVFVEALRDPHAAVLTAARADRSSFGCGHDGDYTYFGEAFFGRQLRRTYSFVEAFEQARAQIEAREKNEDRVHSYPQMEIGSAIAPVLDDLAARLGAGPAPDEGSPSGESVSAQEIDWSRPSRTDPQ